MFTNINPLIILLIILGVIYFFKNDNSLQVPFHDNIEKLTLENRNYRQVLFTEKQRNLQLVLMSLLPKQDIGMEKHPHTTQFIRVEKGYGVAIIEGKEYSMNDGDVVVIPPNSEHNVINLSETSRLQLYVIYTPAEHAEKTIELNKPKNSHH